MMTMNRKEAYAFVVGQIEAEGFHDPKSILQAVGMNPMSLAEKSMRCKNKEELYELAEETVRKIKSFSDGYFEGMQRKPLPPNEKKELARRLRLIRSGVGSSRQLEHQKTELKSYIASLIQDGYRFNTDTVKKMGEAIR